MLGHLISFRADKEPRLVFWNNEQVESLGLQGKELNMKFSDYLLCTGFQELETYTKCPHKLKGMKQCGYCKHRDITKVYARLDFEGFEELKEEYVKQDFSVYLASFGTEIVKCGVTKSERLETRLWEQGADHWAELMTFNDGNEAYAMETTIQQKFRLHDFVRNDTKLELLNKPKSPDALRMKIEEIKACTDFRDKLCDSEIKINGNIFPVPESFDVSYSINGKVTGSKGQLLFFENDEKSFVVPMNKMAGRVFLLKAKSDEKPAV